MTAIKAKEDVLERAGYKYSFDRELYVNWTDKKAFSIEFVNNHSTNEIEQSIYEDGPDDGWRFFFNTPPSEAVKRELNHVLG